MVKKLIISVLVVVAAYAAVFAIIISRTRTHEIKYFDFEFNGKSYVMHTDMPKDSVELLLGKPMGKNYNMLTNTMYESWIYYTDRNAMYADTCLDTERLSVEFEDGKLKRITL